ncbi:MULTISPECIES: DUF4349 domain-containing protein [Eubacteriales]|uniref:DUF4349 domain-containing protein n=1 Tax=Eubacteriales TaxID=186802 RepID=UPI000B381FF3|nr:MULTISPECIES: DUF4349 domain-containing protein [Eubacteriales]MDY4167452.1 DUF4349 domain-containing protein [Fournierella sp.]OUP23102.1 hypothetical protein B5F28_13035 [Gemmiger sp. An194]
MKHNKHWLAAALAAALFAGLLTGCGGSSTAVTSSAAVQEMAGAAMEDAANGTGTGTGVTDLDSGALTPQDSRKIIYNATLWLETKQYDQASADLLEAASQAGAYVQSSESSGSAERGDRSVYYTLRVPADNYSEFLNAAAQAANLVRRSESSQDVTAEYVDLEARLASLEQQRQRLDELAAKAESLEDLLAIEQQRSEVQYQIESYTGQMNVLQDQISYSTVEVYLDEVTELTPQSPSFLSRVGSAFRGSWNGFVSVVQELVIGLIYLLPFLVVAAVVIVLVVLLARRAARKRPQPAQQKRPDGENGSQPPKYTQMK